MIVKLVNTPSVLAELLSKQTEPEVANTVQDASL
jgi:hypothetical protein